MSSKTQQLRTSLYLVNRADALLGALRFFAADSSDCNEKRLQFLAQSDFWEWEIDNLIYSFTNLEERTRSWGSPGATLDNLRKLGVAVDVKLLKRVRWRNQWRVQKSRTRVAPVEMLRETIETWNALIDLVEAHFIEPTRASAERWNTQTRRNLNALRKQMPQVELSGDASMRSGEQSRP